MSKSTVLPDHLCMTASVLKQLLVYTFQLHRAGNFQVLKTLSREKSSSIYLKDFIDFLNTDIFFHLL